MDRIVALRCLTAAALIGIASQALFFRTAPGLNALLIALAVLLAGVAVAWPVRRIDLPDLWIPIATVAVVAMVAIRTDETLVFLDVVTGMTLLGASMAAIGGGRLTRRSAVAITTMGFIVLGWIVVGVFRVLPASRLPEGSGARRVPAPVVRIARGVVIAVPVLFLFGALFASADAIFASWTDGLLDWNLELGQLPERAAIALLVAWAVAGLVAVAAGALDVEPGAERDAGAAAPEMQSLGAAVATPAAAATPRLLRLGHVEATIVLVAVTALFAVFVGLQVAYLFGGLDTLSAGGITYSSYARRGFFELVAATGLAGGLVLVLHAVIERRTLTFVGAAVALAALNVVILASAALRLRLYQEAYGWTELRFYIYATMAWMALLIAGGIVLLVRDRLRWIAHLMAMSAVVVLVVVNVVGAQRHVAEQNVARLLNPGLVPEDGRAGIDLEYLRYLGDDAIPAFVEALPALDPYDQGLVTDELRDRWRELNELEATAWPAWNLARERARDALRPLFGG
ncbi:MAG TPA: DUF4173 domain-containing protein [Candidatus Limnocylindrales bacterium]|nr:DUF4173 domain-containing protein [Candidatus Limnocylindrales bacterium]